MNLSGYDRRRADLHQLIKGTGYAFPPVLISRSSACLITQSYISSYPASGLVLISPVIAPDYVSSLLPGHLKEFDYEPHFPILVMSTATESRQASQHRLLATNVDKCVLQSEDCGPADGKNLTQHAEIIRNLEGWMDDIGF